MHFTALYNLLTTFSTENVKICLSSGKFQDLQCYKRTHSPWSWRENYRCPHQWHHQHHDHQKRGARGLRHRAGGNDVIRRNEHPWADCVLHRVGYCAWEAAGERKTAGRVLFCPKRSDYDDCRYHYVVSCKIRATRIRVLHFPCSSLHC